MEEENNANLGALTPEEVEHAKAIDEQGESFFKEEDSPDAAPVEVEPADTAEEAEPAEPAPVEAEAAEPEEPAEPAPVEAEAAEPEEPEPTDETPQQDAFVAKIAVDENTSVEDLKTALSDLDKKFDDGEIEAAAYRQESRDLQQRIFTREMSESINQQSAQQQWEYSQSRFFSSQEGAKFEKDSVLRSALNGALKDLYQDQENVGKAHAWYLSKAASMVNERFGTAPAKAEPEVLATPEPPKIGDSNRGTSEVPETLHGLPESEQSSTGGEFDSLDTLQGVELESAFSRMSRDQQDRYLKG